MLFKKLLFKQNHKFILFAYKNNFITNNLNRHYTTQISVDLKTSSSIPSSTDTLTNSDPEWENALPYEKIPGPTPFGLIRSYLPGGKYYDKSLFEINRLYRVEYGDILKIPGIFGKRDLIITFIPENIRKIFRTEGIWPVRRGLDSIIYYRKIARPEFFENAGGLVVEQGEKWAHFRTIVNPVMMQPKIIKFYVPTIDEVVNDFLLRIKEIRDPTTLEVPGNFFDEINHYTLESIGVIALDTRFGLINNFDNNEKAKKVFSALRDFFQLAYELDFKPSIWKYIRTPKFIKYIKTLDTMTQLISEYIDEAQLKLKTNGTKNKSEESVLQKLLKVDKKVARVMALDMMIAGVDTTSTAFVSCLFQLAKNPDKQEILRNEIKNILPDKNAKLNANKMNNLPYLRGCIKESLRMMPVIMGNLRSTGQDIVLSGYRVPKSTDISLSSFLIQMDDKYFPNAKKFIPERWLRETHKSKYNNNNNNNNNNECPSARDGDPFTFLPFGFGPRTCVGKRFVELEIECALVKFIRNFYVEFNHPDIVFKSNLINLPDCDLKFKFIDIKN